MLDIDTLLGTEQLFDSHYKLLRPLSTDGATADVWLAIDTNTIDTEYDEKNYTIHNKDDESGMLVAIKIYRPKNALDIDGEQRFRDEYKIVYECRHENLLQPTSFAIYKDIPYLVLPYCKNGSSEQLIGKKQSEEEIWKFVSDVASGLAKLHSNQPQIIHQDIKPANILIDNNRNYAITDFGISSKTNGMHGNYYDDENSGTFAYMAPERFNENLTPVPESDIWAFGATLCEILTGKVPFGEEGGKSQNDNSPMPPLPSLPSSIRNLIHACLQKDPKKRPTAQQILQAARAKKYPIKSKKNLVVTICLLLCLLIGVAVYFFLEKEKSMHQQETVEEIFEKAFRQMNTDNIDTLKIGLHTMDSLSKTEYVPALYEMAFTYGWYEDTLSVQRKKLLGIKTTDDGFPDSTELSIKVKGWFLDILKKNDSTYPLLNAKAVYHLASYFGDKRAYDNDKTKVEYEIALKYLDISEGWASIAKDSSKYDLLNRIDKTRKIIYDIKQKQENEE